MKINLRKANALQLAITQAINETEVKTSVSISRFDLAPTKFVSARSDHKAAIQKKFDLIDALYEVRGLISAAGELASVPFILAQMAAVEKKIAIVTPLAAVKEFAPDPNTLRDQHQDMKSEVVGQNAYHRRRDEIDVNIIEATDEYVAKLAELRREKQRLSDELLQKNVTNEVTLPTKVVETLKEHHLV